MNKHKTTYKSLMLQTLKELKNPNKQASEISKKFKKVKININLT